MRHTIQPVDVDAVHQQRIALRPIIAIERERTLYRESRVDDTAISLAEKIVDTEIENVYSTPKPSLSVLEPLELLELSFLTGSYFSVSVVWV